jgi:hypothetical protein
MEEEWMCVWGALGVVEVMVVMVECVHMWCHV